MVVDETVLLQKGVIVHLDFDFLLTCCEVEPFRSIAELKQGSRQIQIRLLVTILVLGLSLVASVSQVYRHLDRVDWQL